MKWIIGLVLAATTGLAVLQFANPIRRSHVPPNGFVPDEQTAIRIAEAVWIPLYGKEQIDAEKPFQVRLQNGVWIVKGKPIPQGMFGGVAIAEISKRDGAIILVSHGE